MLFRSEMNIKAKDDDDQMMGRKDREDHVAGEMIKTISKTGKSINVVIDWDMYVKHFEKISRDDLVDTIVKNLSQVKMKIPKDLIRQYSDESGREVFIKTATLQVMSTPEYQLC